MKRIAHLIDQSTRLSERESQVAQLVLARGYSVRGTARLLGIARRTARTVMDRVYAKFGL